MFQLAKLDVDRLAKQLDEVVKPMQKHFSYKPGAYYNHALFFLSIAIHKVCHVQVSTFDLEFCPNSSSACMHSNFKLIKEIDPLIAQTRQCHMCWRFYLKMHE